MEHINNFSKFNEHIYNKALSNDSKNWGENYKKLITYVKKMIKERQITVFSEKGNILEFKIKERKYKINKEKKICLFKTFKGAENEVELDLTEDQLKELI